MPRNCEHTLRAYCRTIWFPVLSWCWEKLPLTPSGKLDRRALPAPDLDACADEQHEPPHGEIETAIARIWQETLQVARVGRQDNFFELGWSFAAGSQGPHPNQPGICLYSESQGPVRKSHS